MEEWRVFPKGAAYAPATNTWRLLPDAPVAPRSGHSAVWTGKEMIVYGGIVDPGQATAIDDGAAYDPVTDKWRRLPAWPLEPRVGHKAIWTGEEMIVWGGNGHQPGHAEGDYSIGATFRPSENKWRALPAAPPNDDKAIGQKGRVSHALIWTGKELLVWGGEAPVYPNQTHDGGFALDLSERKWRALPPAPLSARRRIGAVWTGREMVIWGGYGETSFADGASYDPTLNRWRAMSESPLGPISEHYAVWSDTEMILWGGWPGSESSADGAAYDPSTDTWRHIPQAPVIGREAGAFAWVETGVFIWGGVHSQAGDDSFASQVLGDGAVYYPGR